MLADLHTHTSRSDGTCDAAAMAAAARAAGVDVLAVTDHLTLPAAMDPACGCSVAEADLPTLAVEVAAAAEGSPVEVLLGFECDWYPGCEGNVARWSRGAALLLGSVHWIGPQEGGAWIDDPDDLHIWEELGPDEVWRRYAAAWCAACESPAGLRKGVGAFYPCGALLDAFVRAGVPMTFGSDAHRAEDVAWGLERAHAYAWWHGVRAQEVPGRDGWRSVPL